MNCVVLFLSMGLCPVQAQSEDWPRFQGPNATGKIAEIKGALKWKKKGPEELWSVPVGAGYGGPAVRDGEVYLLDREPRRKDFLRVFDLETGEEKWSYGYEAEGRLNFPGSRTVPTVEEKHVYTSGAFGHVHCFDRETHEVVWSLDMEEVYGGVQPTFGWSASPLVIDDMVVLTPLGDDVGLVALDRFTGEELWVTERVGNSHSSPVLMELLGKEQILFLSTTFRASGQEQAAPTTMWSFEPSDGSVIWQHVTTLTRVPVPGPVKIDDERFFVTGGYRSGSKLFEISEKGGEYELEELFHIERGAQVHLPILHDDHLYLIVNENWNNQRARQKEGGLLCLTLKGKEKWRTENDPYFGRGNAILIGDQLVIQDGHTGVLRVVEASPRKYKQVAEANVFGTDDDKDRQMWSPMAVAGKRLLLRSQDVLVCVGL